MKILMFGVRPDEEFSIRKFAKHHNIQVDTTSDSLNDNNVDKLNGYDGVSTHTASQNPSFYEKLHKIGIKQLAVRHTGYEIVNLDAAKENNIIVTNVPAYSPRSVSEMTLTQVMYLLRHIGPIQNSEKNHDFQWKGLEASEIHNLTVGVIGAGNIGSASAQIFHALGANVLVNDPIHNPKLKDIVTYVTRNKLLQESDIITVHTPLNNNTKHLINKDAFIKMNNDAIFINDARGGIVNTNALIDALESNEIAGAGLDTVEGEDKVFNHNLSNQNIKDDRIKKLLNMSNVIMTPHVGFYTDVSVQNMVDISLTDIINIINGKKTEHQVN